MPRSEIKFEPKLSLFTTPEPMAKTSSKNILKKQQQHKKCIHI